MRANVDAQKLERLMQMLGKEAQGSGCIYLTDGASALVEAMYTQKLFSLSELGDCFEAIVPELIRFPSLNPDILRSKVENFIERFEDQPEEKQS